MRGGYWRFQAQYLRRIRLPRWEEITPQVKDALNFAVEHDDVTSRNEAVFDLYQLSRNERAALGGTGG